MRRLKVTGIILMTLAPLVAAADVVTAVLGTISKG
jgi:hypothetical protein